LPVNNNIIHHPLPAAYHYLNLLLSSPVDPIAFLPLLDSLNDKDIIILLEHCLYWANLYLNQNYKIIIDQKTILKIPQLFGWTNILLDKFMLKLTTPKFTSIILRLYSNICSLEENFIQIMTVGGMIESIRDPMPSIQINSDYLIFIRDCSSTIK
jgi:hypothetical protein